MIRKLQAITSRFSRDRQPAPTMKRTLLIFEENSARSPSLRDGDAVASICVHSDHCSSVIHGAIRYSSSLDEALDLFRDSSGKFTFPEKP